MASFRLLRRAPYRVSGLIFIAGAFLLWNTLGKHYEIPRIEIPRLVKMESFQKEMKQDEKSQRDRLAASWAQDKLIHDGTWQQVPGEREVYVYSAYYDDRVTFPVVRVMTILREVKKSIEDHLYCVLTFSKNPITTQMVAAVKVRIGFGARLDGKPFKQYILNCQLNSMDPPAHVSIVHQPNEDPKIYFPVQIPEKSDKRMNFMVCTCGSYGFTPPHKLIEWIEYLRMFGVDHVTIYDDSIAPESMKVFQYYAERNIVDIRQTRNMMNDSSKKVLWLHNTPLLNDCIYRNMHKYHKIIMNDLDELFVPRTNDTYLELIDTIQHNACGDDLTRNYVFRNAYFLLDIPGEDLNQSDHLVTLRHRRRLDISKPGYWVKSIIDPRACTYMHNHLCWGVLPMYKLSYVKCDVPVELAFSHHYKNCDFDWKHHDGLCEEKMRDAVTDDFMLKFRDKIIARVKPVIEDLHLEPL